MKEFNNWKHEKFCSKCTDSNGGARCFFECRPIFEMYEEAWKAALEMLLAKHDDTDNWGNVACSILEELEKEEPIDG
jgi:hypothetical protein